MQLSLPGEGNGLGAWFGDAVGKGEMYALVNRQEEHAASVAYHVACGWR